MDNLQKGKFGEDAVAKFLKKNKYKILERNYKTNSGEIDIIAENKEYLVFVEVKTRSEGQMLEPRFSVDRKKQNKILRTASMYMQRNKNTKQPRFDIAEVILKQKGKPEINYLDNAFWQGGDYAVF